MKNKIIVSGLWYHPIKSCQPIFLKKSEVCETGIKYDRHWMIVDEYGNFVSQRTHKSMALINTLITMDSLSFFTPLQAIFIMPVNKEGKRTQVKVHNDVFEAIEEGDEAAEYFTYYLSKEIPGKYRLVRMLDISERLSKSGGANISFADAFPFLVISEESLADLNSRMSEKLPIDSFRTNILISGSPVPYWEDTIPSFKISGVEFINKGPCIRCPITTTNQKTGVRGKEPLATLAKYRRYEAPDGRKGVIFGCNFDHIGTGWISVGDILEFT